MTLALVATVLTALYVVSCLLNRMIAPQSQIGDLPGPPAQSWATGRCIYALLDFSISLFFPGNLRQLFNAKGLPFHQSLTDIYGGIAKIYGFFGDEQLYIADPHALQHIILKDQDAFEETPIFTEQVPLIPTEADAYDFFRTNKVIFGPGLVATTGKCRLLVSSQRISE